MVGRVYKAAVVIIAYEPQIKALDEVCKCVLRQGSVLIVVDNSEKTEISKKIDPGVIYVSMNGNKGIAAALNRGVRVAIENKADCITFLDQDSLISEDLLTVLQSSLTEKVKFVAPVPIDQTTKEEYPSFIMTKFGNYKELYAKGCSEPQKVDIVITSGTTVKTEVFALAGFFDEDFFIDFVDIEWCLRCKKVGVDIYLLPNVQMGHKIGKETKKVLFLNINMHNPYRTYYKIRNSFLLFAKKLPPIFVLKQIAAAVILNFFGMFGEAEWREYMHSYFTGILHGLLGKKGKLKNEKRKN